MNISLNDQNIAMDKFGRYRLNDLHKAALNAGLDVVHKTPSEFLRTQMAQAFVDVIEKSGQGDHSPVESLPRGKKQGTFADELVALKYCGWLHPTFEVHVYRVYQQASRDEFLRIHERSLASLEFRPMTDALLEHRTKLGLKTMHYHYANECDLLNKIVLGKTAKEFRESMCLDASVSLRDKLSKHQVEAIGYLQRTNTTLIEEGYTFEERKYKLQSRFDRKFAAKCESDFLISK